MQITVHNPDVVAGLKQLVIVLTQTNVLLAAIVDELKAEPVTGIEVDPGKPTTH